MIRKFKNFIIYKKLYWKFGHIISPNDWAEYYGTSVVNRRNFYSEFIQKTNIRAIFEFGCASGPNLFNIDNNVPWDLYYFGYDISAAAINTQEIKQKKIPTSFQQKLIRSFLNQN